MKLIDLLVQELPKRGGWPEGAEIAVQDADSQICFSSHSDVYADKGQTSWFGGDWGDGDWNNPFIDTIADDRHKCIVSRKQYESALAVSQKPTWNGEGLPPSGVECEARLRCNDGEWFFFRCVGVDCGVAFGWAGKEAVTLGKGSYEFRPIRSEADKKRDAAVKAIDYWLPECIPDTPNEFYHAKKIYDAIAAGKIPGVKLED